MGGRTTDDKLCLSENGTVFFLDGGLSSPTTLTHYLVGMDYLSIGFCFSGTFLLLTEGPCGKKLTM